MNPASPPDTATLPDYGGGGIANLMWSIAAAFGVPHLLVVSGEATFNNRADARLELWEHTVIPLLDRFVELHRMSEGPKGVFMVPGMEIFFRRLGEAFCAAGAFRLTFIDVGGQLAAGTIGFEFGKTSSLYNSAFDRTWGNLAPGMVLVGEDIRLAIGSGCELFDLLKGDYAYKYRFGAVPRAIKRLVVTR